MRAVLSSLLAVPLLLAADLSIDLTTGSQLVAEAADYTGRIKRVRIRERRSGGYAVVMVTENSPEQLLTPGRLSVTLEPLDGGPALTPRADLLTERMEDLRFETPLPSVEALFGVVVGINTTKESAEVPLEALLEGAEGNNWGQTLPVGNPDEPDATEVRARVEIDADGERLVELSVRARGGADLAGTTAFVTGTWADTDEPFAKDVGLLGAIRRHTLVFDAEPGDQDPGDFAYNLIGDWTFDDSAAQDRSSFTVDLDGTPNGPRIEQVVLRETRRGGTRLVTRVSSPDDRPIVLEASVSEADGASVIALADEAPQWTEHQYSVPVQFNQDPTGATYSVFLTGQDADGNIITEGTPVFVTAERPTLDDPFYDGTLFNDNTSMVALLPDSEDSWQLVVHAATEVPAASYRLQFDEPFEGPVPSETVVRAETQEVWHQYRQVARNTPLAELPRTINTSISGEDGSIAATASATEIEGAAIRSERNVDDIDVFIQELGVNPNSAKKRIRQRAVQRRRIVRR